MEEEDLDIANQTFYSRMTTLTYNLWNPGYPISFDKIPKGQDYHEESEIYDFNTPLCNYKLKESMQHDDKYRKKAIKNFFEDIDNFDKKIDRKIEFYPVRISRVGNKESPTKIRDNESVAASVVSNRTAKTNLTEKTYKSGRTDDSRMSYKPRTPTNYERQHAEKIRDMKLRREEKKQSEEKLSPEEKEARDLKREKAKKAYKQQISKSPEQRYKHLAIAQDEAQNSPSRDPVKVTESEYRKELLEKFKKNHPDGPLPQPMHTKRQFL